MHFRDGRGAWADIDTRLSKLHGRLLNRSNSFSTSLPLDIERDSVRVRKGDRWLAFRLRGARGHVQARGNEALYRDALPGIDVGYRTLADSVKETITLKRRATARRFTFDLDMSRGLRPDVLASRGLVLRDKTGRPRLSMAAPFVVDAKGAERRVKLELHRVSRMWRLTYVLDSRWLDRPGRAWPVVVDPAVYPTLDRDCYLAAGAPDSSFCGSEFMKVGTFAGQNHNAILSFDLNGAVPRGAEVKGATLRIKLTAQDTNVHTPLKAFPLKQEWTGAATWNRNDGTDRWVEPGGEYDDQAAFEYGDAIFNSTIVPPGDRYFTGFKVAEDWVAGRRPNHGVLIRAEGTGNGAYIAASEASSSCPTPGTCTSADAPYLEINYTHKTGQIRGHVYEQQKLSDRIGLSVDVSNGNLRLQQTDFSMPGGLGPAVSMQRAYNSLEPQNGVMGQGWESTAGEDLHLLQAAGADYMILHDSTGAEFTYRFDEPNNRYLTPPGRNDKLVRLASTWELTDDASQTKLVFENHTKSGRLQKIVDRNGRETKFNYTTVGSNNATSISDSNNDATLDNADDLRFSYTGNRLTSMTDPAARGYAYGYDANNRLTSYTDPQNGASFKTLYEYNGPNSTLSKVTTPGGNITTIEYYPYGHEHEGRVKAVTRVTNTTTMAGPTTTFSYLIRRDGSGETEITDPVGVASPDGNDRITRQIFDDQGRVTKTIDALGRTSSRKLTTNSNVESYSSPMNTGTTPNTSFNYQSGTDNLLGTTTPTGASTQPITSSTAYGNTSNFPASPATAGSEYLPTTGTNAQGRTTTIEYMAGNGNVSAVRDQLSVQNNVTMTYASTNPLDPFPAVDLKSGQLRKITDARGNDTTYGYDTKGNVNKVTPPLPLGATEMTYDTNLARIGQVKDGIGRYRFLEYDNLDRLTKIVFSANNVKETTDESVTYTHDRDGNKLTEADKNAAGVTQTTTNTYDKLNRLTNEALPYGGRSNAYSFDPVGNLKSLTDGGGKVEYAYDATNQVRAVFEPGTAKPTKFEHDQDGRRSKTIYPNGVVMEEKYDDASRTTEIVSHTGNPATPLQRFLYGYANFNESAAPFCPTEVDLADDTKTRQHPMRTSMTDTVAGRQTRYCYDQLDRLVKARTASSTGTWSSNATQAQYDYALDGSGNIIKRVAAGSGPVALAGTTSYGYNAANQLCWKIGSDTSPTATQTCPATPVGATTYAFDLNGNQTTGAMTYNLRDHTTSLGTFLGGGQQRRITEPGAVTLQTNVLGLGSSNTTYWTRDENGVPVSQRNATGRQYYLFDALGSVTGMTGPGPSPTVTRSYDYDPYGNVAATTGTTTDYLKFAGGYAGPGSAGLHHFGQRFYDPTLGRWSQIDPLNQASDLREANRYLYAGGDPVNLADPSGMGVGDWVDDAVDWTDQATRDVQGTYNEYVRDPLAKSRLARMTVRCVVGGGAVGVAAKVAGGPVAGAAVAGCVGVNLIRRGK